MLAFHSHFLPFLQIKAYIFDPNSEICLCDSNKILPYYIFFIDVLMENGINFFQIVIFLIELNKLYDHFSIFFRISFFEYGCATLKIMCWLYSISSFRIQFAKLSNGIGLIILEVEHFQIFFFCLALFAEFGVAECGHEMHLKEFIIFVYHDFEVF